MSASLSVSESLAAELEYIGLDIESLSENVYTTVESLAEFFQMAWSIILVLLIAWIIGKSLQLLLGLGLRAARFDLLADKTGLGTLLRKIGIDNLPSYVIANAVYWLILLFGAVVALTATRVTPLLNHLNAILLFVPQILSVLVLLVVTRYLAYFLRLTTRGVLKGIGVPDENRYGWVMFGIAWILGALTALAALGAQRDHLLLLGELLLYALAVIAATFGSVSAFLISRELVFGWFIRRRIKPGEEIYVEGTPGTVKGFLGFGVEVYQQGDVVILPYSKLGGDLVRKKVIG